MLNGGLLNAKAKCYPLTACKANALLASQTCATNVLLMFRNNSLLSILQYCGSKAIMPTDLLKSNYMCTCAGEIEEVTGSLMLSLVIETWTFLQQCSSLEHHLAFDYSKNSRMSATAGSIHDPTAVYVYLQQHASMHHSFCLLCVLTINLQASKG